MEHHDRPHASPSFVNVFVLLLFAAVIAFASSVGTYMFMTSRQSGESSTNQPLIVPPPQTAVAPTSTTLLQNQTSTTNVQTPIISIIRESPSCENEYARFKVLNNRVPVGSVSVPNCDISTIGEVLAIKNNRVYFTIKLGGLGGYILYGSYNNLYELNLADNSISRLHDWDYLTDIDVSLDTNFLVYSFSSSSDSKKIVVRNLSNGIETPYVFSQISRDAQIGSFKFSPNNEKLAIAVGYGPDNERGEIYILTLKNSTFDLYQKTKTPPRIKEWIDNNQINWN